jgi:integrase
VKGKHKHATVSEIICDRMEVAKSLDSFDDERYRLLWWKNRLGNRAVRSILAGDIEEAKRDLLEGHDRNPAKQRRPASVNRYLAALKAAFSLAIRNKKADSNPVKDVKLEREKNERVRYLSEEEEECLFAILPQRYHSLVRVAIHTGLRRTEQLSLEWGDIDFKLGQIIVRDSKPDKSRVVPMDQTVTEILRGLSKVRLINNPYVFPGEKTGQRLKDIPKYWEQYLKEAGIKNFRWHDLRHTFASRLVMAGVNLYTVSQLLGHHDIKMTMRYAHLSPGYLKAAVGVIDKQPAPFPAPVESGRL